MNAIAIVGMACLYPDADSPQQLWESVLAQRRAFRRMPAERLNLADYAASDDPQADSIYISEGAFIKDYEFDRLGFRIAGSTYRSADLCHWLALDIAGRALADAGFGDGKGLPTDSTGVLLGNTLTGEFSRAALMRLRWPYVRRHLDAALAGQDWDAGRRLEFLRQLETAYKQPFPPVDAETLAGGLSNTIAGRICNHFNLRGGGYTLDGACSSSLLAVANACTALSCGDLDVALAGGVDLSMDPFELIGFSKTGALAHGEMRVYDSRADGFLPGEGCGFAVLMRHEDALARGLRCYGLIRGWGVSSDGGGGITRPEPAGQTLALRRAYARAGYGLDSVALFEGHGTGTPVGDDVELRSLTAARQAANSHAPAAAVGSIKANIGHCKAAAGIAGFIKAALAVHHQILPPHAGFQQPHPILAEQHHALRLLNQPESWPQSLPLRAGVSAFGFGGINVHIALEGLASARRQGLTPAEADLSASPQDVELFLFSADGHSPLLAEIEALADIAPGLACSELADLAAVLAARPETGVMKAACLAATPKQLGEQLDRMRQWLLAGVTRRLDTDNGVFLACPDREPRIGFLFPGQAAPVRVDGGMPARRFPAIAEFYRQAGLAQNAEQTPGTAVAQPAIVAAEIAGWRLLNHFGVQAERAMGHSLGELTALCWGGAMSQRTLLQLSRSRGAAMEANGQPGVMASLEADETETLAWLAHHGGAVIAGLNSPRQTVISGTAEAVRKVCERAAEQGRAVNRLPVANAFHSPFMQAAARLFVWPLAQADITALSRPVISTVSGNVLTANADLRALLIRQLTSPVRFSHAFGQLLPGMDLLLEVGPGRILSGLAVANGCEIPVMSIDSGGPSLRPLFTALAAAYVSGAPLHREALFAGRHVRPFNPARRPGFFANPCESAPQPTATGSSIAPPAVVRPAAASEPPDAVAPAAQSVLEQVRRLVAQRAELPVSAVLDRHRLLQDLHLNSITVGQLVTDLCRQLQLPLPLAPAEYAVSTVADIAEALAAQQQNGMPQADSAAVAAGVDAWVQAFSIQAGEIPLPAAPAGVAPAGPGDWRLFPPEAGPLATAIYDGLVAWGGAGVLVCLPPQPENLPVDSLLAAARAVLQSAAEANRFVLVQHDGVAGAFARSLYEENRALTVCVADVPPIAAAAAWVLAEVRSAQGFSEARYDAAGKRYQQQMRLLPVIEPADSPPALDNKDILLVSGGGKGIAAECALAMNKRHGVRLALLGRARPEEDAELAANLLRFAAHGVAYRYFATDICDAGAVRRTVAELEAEWGPVTAILHGAGVNRPQLIQTLDMAAAEATLTPKIQGLQNLLAAVRADSLKRLISFGSIIGRTGMRGEADYALANAWLTRLTEDFQAAHPACRCLALEWSIWSGVGMGERLGRVDALLREGVTPISPDQGVAWLLRLLNAASPPVAIMISGRLGAEPAIAMPAQHLPFLRFIEQPRVFYPGVELVVDAELSLSTDPYLADHVFKGECLLPAVIGLEAMAQAAMALAGENRAPGFEQVEFLHPVVAPRGRPLRLRLAALLRGADRVEVVLRCDRTGFQVDHFRGFACFGVAPPQTADKVAESSPTHADIDIKTALYDTGLLFHSGRFRRLQAYRQLSARRCRAEIMPRNDDWFARYLPAELVLGDPAARDAGMHAIQACIPHLRLLPIGLERLIPGNLHTPGPWLAEARERESDGNLFVYDVSLFGQSGELKERWEGLRLKLVEPVSHPVWPLALLGPYLERKLDQLSPRTRLRLALGQAAAQNLRGSLAENADGLRRPDGKPDTLGDTVASASHIGDSVFMVLGFGALACDWQDVEAGGNLPELLGAERHALAEAVAARLGENPDTSAIRLWSSMECLKKAGLPANTPLSLHSHAEPGWVTLAAGGCRIASYATCLQEYPGTHVFAVLLDAPAAQSHPPDAGQPVEAIATSG
ncbi:MAG: type I polyketide synthase [Methylococcales bacterium]|nr:type I polyketide synthase [Methylococcales bacterium]